MDTWTSRSTILKPTPSSHKKNTQISIQLKFADNGGSGGRRSSRDYDAYNRDNSPSRYDSPSHRYEPRAQSPVRRKEYENSPPRRSDQYGDSPYRSPSPGPARNYDDSPPRYPDQRPYDDSDDEGSIGRAVDGSPRSGGSKGTKRKRDHDGRGRHSPVDRDRRGSSRERQKKKSKKSDAPCKYWLEGICDKVCFLLRCLGCLL